MEIPRHRNGYEYSGHLSPGTRSALAIRQPVASTGNTRRGPPGDLLRNAAIAATVHAAVTSLAPSSRGSYPVRLRSGRARRTICHACRSRIGDKLSDGHRMSVRAFRKGCCTPANGQMTPPCRGSPYLQARQRAALRVVPQRRPSLHSNSRIAASTARLSPGPKLAAFTTAAFSARRIFSIFIASTTASGWPASTLSPGAT